MDRFEAMRTLVAAVDGGSLSAASRALNVPLPTVSRRVSDLEGYLRVQLVIRTSRKLLLTDAGRAYVATCRQILDELDDAERLASGEYRTPRGELLITAPVMFGRLHVEPVVLDFLKAYPDINVRLILADYLIDLVENRVDLAVRIFVSRSTPAAPHTTQVISVSVVSTHVTPRAISRTTWRRRSVSVGVLLKSSSGIDTPSTTDSTPTTPRR